MSDQGKYINHYVDNAVGMLHEYISQILQLRTQVKVQADLIQEKENQIAELKQNKTANQLMTDDRGRLQVMLEEANHKIGHLSVIANQYGELKQKLAETTKELENARKQLGRRVKKSNDVELNKENTETNDF